MSTVMYCYRIDKDKFWSFYDNLVKWYLQDENQRYFLHRLWEISAFSLVESGDELNKIRRNKENHIRLQLFDEGNTWLFRVLESTYQFLNHSELFEDAEPIFYDNRADMPDEWLENESVADWLDEQITKRHYFTVTIIDGQTIWNLFCDWQVEQRKDKPNDS